MTYSEGKISLVDLVNLKVIKIAETEDRDFGYGKGYLSEDGESIVFFRGNGSVVRAAFTEGVPIECSIRDSGDSLMIKFSGKIDAHYEIESSPDLIDWTLLESGLDGTGEDQEFPIDSSEEHQRFFRVVEFLR